MNVKKIILATVVIGAAWFLMDWVIHGMLLMGLYEQTPNLWRTEMDPAHQLIGLFGHVVLFVLFYVYMIKPKDCSQGLKYGCWTGLLGGFGMGMSYLWMPISFILACAWFFAFWAESLVAGALLGWIIKDT